MFSEELIKRTKEMSITVIRLVTSLPNSIYLNLITKEKGEIILREIFELVAIFAASAKTAKLNHK